MQTDGQMNGRRGWYDEANSRFLQFFEQAYVLHKYEVMGISGYINKAYGSYRNDSSSEKGSTMLEFSLA
jgi:hypothetical protein